MPRLDSILRYKVYDCAHETESMNNSPEVLTIAKLTREGGVNVQTVRYYERRGLIPKPARALSGYRLYERAAVKPFSFCAPCAIAWFLARRDRGIAINANAAGCHLCRHSDKGAPEN